MPATTAKGYPYPLTTDPFLPATTDFPALAAAIESKSAREVAAVLSAASVLDVGVVGQIRAGRELVATDFTTLLGLGTPVGLWDAGSLVNLGSGGNLTNKGAVPLTAKGLAGTANHAALFAGSTGQSLYIADTGAADPFRIKTGAWGGWMRTAKQSGGQEILAKYRITGGQRGFRLYVQGAQANAEISLDGANPITASGITNVADDRLHFIVATFDGSVLRLYVDGVLEATAAAAGSIFGGTAPFNIGSFDADAGTAAQNPHFGRIAVPFVTPDVLSEDEIRVLMAAKVAHGYAVTPTRSHLAVRRKRKGGPLVTGDFTATPKVLYNFTAGSLADAGSLGSNLTNNNGAVSVAGGDGQTGGAFQFTSASSMNLSGTDAGLPATTTARTITARFKSSASGAVQVIALYGTAAGNAYVFMGLNASGQIMAGDGATQALSPGSYNDGQWHSAVFTYDGAAADGVKFKLYVDGKCVAGSTSTLVSTTLAGAGKLRIGSDTTPGSFFSGSIDTVAINDYAMAADEIASLEAKGSVALPASEKNSGDNVEAMDATNVYVLFDDLDSQHSVDLRVAA